MRSPCSADPVTFLGIDRGGAMNLLYRKSRADWRQKEEEPKKGSGTSFRRHFRMGFMTMPASQERAPLPCAAAMAPRSLSCHSVGSTADMQPPTKPKRNPNTKLSLTAEGRIRKDGSLKYSSDFHKMAPQKPQRSPHTNLSSSSSSRPSSSSALLPNPSSPEEPVYIEMVGHASRGPPPPRDAPSRGPRPPPPDEDSDGGEAIYEEMQCPLHEGPQHAARRRPRPPPPRTPDLDIPPPFPNLLHHRPPLLGAPSGKGHKVSRTPLASSKLPVPQEKPQLPPSGRARSHSTPLPPQTSSQRRPDSELPPCRGAGFPQEKGASLLPVPHGHARDKALSYTMVYSSLKVTHSLLPAAQVEEKTEREVAVLAGLITPLTSRPPSAHLRQEQPSPVVWTYPAGKRPPAYESGAKGARGGAHRAEPGGGGRAAEEDRVGAVWALQRATPCGGSPAGEQLVNGSRVWNGTQRRSEVGGHMASGIPVRSQQSLDSAITRAGSRSGLPVPCQTFPACHRNA
ncbi:LOW QUALITY PROTEIN: neuronal tyrosine-phosphorylated phosphoinositide-3-kinase adapter 1, partial [Ascaphus truei]|uniref:LOW QUALITY PROTEIN: neuronal tyrosine-phosphorylated phosphoinositide-3-kinase adapter 1 n=1 Tax=Ascaphus truei TaxID=8439 RepID=UPI003F5A47A8